MYSAASEETRTITLGVILIEAVRIFHNKAFARFARKAGIPEAALCQAIREAERGLIAAQLGGDVIKQRIARPGQGKSSGFRVLIVFKPSALAVFVHGFAKNERDNIRHDNCQPSGGWHPNCSPTTTKRSRA